MHLRALPSLALASLASAAYAPAQSLETIIDGWTTPSPLVGGWLLGDPATTHSMVVTILPNGLYFMAHDGPANSDDGGYPGFEIGHATWSPDTGRFTVNEVIADQNGSWGFFDAGLGGAAGTLTINDNLMTLLPDDESERATLVRIASETHPLVGSWFFTSFENGGVDAGFVSFLQPNAEGRGYYFLIEFGLAGEEGLGYPGIERGTYSLINGVLTAAAITDTNGDWGPGEDTFELTLSGDQFTLRDTLDPTGVDSMVFVRVGASAIPEPAHYAAWVGLVGVAFASLRRRRA